MYIVTTMVPLSICVSVMTVILVLTVQQVCTLLRRLPPLSMCVSLLSGILGLTVKQICTLLRRWLLIYVCICLDGYTGTNCETSMYIVTTMIIFSILISVLTGALKLTVKQVWTLLWWWSYPLRWYISWPDGYTKTNCETNTYMQHV